MEKAILTHTKKGSFYVFVFFFLN